MIMRIGIRDAVTVIIDAVAAFCGGRSGKCIARDATSSCVAPPFAIVRARTIANGARCSEFYEVLVRVTITIVIEFVAEFAGWIPGLRIARRRFEIHAGDLASPFTGTDSRDAWQAEVKALVGLPIAVIVLVIAELNIETVTIAVSVIVRCRVAAASRTGCIVVGMLCCACG
ncbi:MAG: hypothetical protein Q7S96_00095 [bacterium]|nr:hypothetical protein [bacterium]